VRHVAVAGDGSVVVAVDTSVQVRGACQMGFNTISGGITHVLIRRGLDAPHVMAGAERIVCASARSIH
jgi:hypothetical protein